MLHFHVFKGLIYLAQKGWDMGLLSRGGGHLREQERIQGYVRKVQELEARAKDRGTNFVLTPSELIEQLERFDRKILTDPRRVMCDVDRLLTWIWCKDWKHYLHVLKPVELDTLDEPLDLGEFLCGVVLEAMRLQSSACKDEAGERALWHLVYFLAHYVEITLCHPVPAR